jgi:hypothetical protein
MDFMKIFSGILTCNSANDCEEMSLTLLYSSVSYPKDCEKLSCFGLLDQIKQ